MSPPAQKAPNGSAAAPSVAERMLPRMATTRIAGSLRQTRSAALMARIIGSDSALSARARLSVISPALPRTSQTPHSCASVGG